MTAKCELCGKEIHDLCKECYYKGNDIWIAEACLTCINYESKTYYSGFCHEHKINVLMMNDCREWEAENQNAD